MAIDTKTAVLGVLLIGIVAMAGWVGFLYVNPVTKTLTKTDEDTEYIYVNPPPEEETVRDGIPLDWSEVDNTSSIIVYNETGDPNEVTLKNILDGITLYWEQEDDPLYMEINEYKPEYMYLNQIVDEVTGITFTGVDILDVLFFANCRYAMDISAKGNAGGINGYLNTTTADILADYDTIVAIAANDVFLDNFVLVKDESTETVYDLQEIRAKTEWEIEIYVDTVLQDFKINRTTIIDIYNPDGWTYGYFKEPGFTGGMYNFNRTFWGTNMSNLLDQCADITPATNYNISAIHMIDGLYDYDKEDIPGYEGLNYDFGLTFNSTDVRNGLDYPFKYGIVNETTRAELPEVTDPNLLMTMTYKQQRLSENGKTKLSKTVSIDTFEYPWDKGYVLKYGSGPFSLVIPGQSRSNYPKWIVQIDITTF